MTMSTMEKSTLIWSPMAITRAVEGSLPVRETLNSAIPTPMTRFASSMITSRLTKFFSFQKGFMVWTFPCSEYPASYFFIIICFREVKSKKSPRSGANPISVIFHYSFKCALSLCSNLSFCSCEQAIFCRRWPPHARLLPAFAVPADFGKQTIKLQCIVISLVSMTEQKILPLIRD